MSKPTKKQIEEVAKRLFFAFYQGQLPRATLKAAWNYKFNPGFHRMAKLVLTELRPDDGYKMPPFMGEATYQGDKTRRARAVKSCKVVRGKVVCE